MNVSFSTARNVTNEMLQGTIDFDTDTHVALLMKAGWSFSTTNHSYLKNIKNNTGSITYNVDATASTITRTAGSFITDYFVQNNWFTTSDGTHTGVYKITSVVSATVLKVEVVSGAVLNETGNPYTAVITTDDEFETGGGYTQGGTAATFTVSDNLLYLDHLDIVTEFGGVATAASPGFIVYDQTHSGAGGDDAIILFARFSDWRVNV